MSAALLGSSAGLGLGATYLHAGLARHAAAHAESQRMADAAAYGYAGSYADARGTGLGVGLERYGFRTPAATKIAAKRAERTTAKKAKRRADLECLTDAVYYEARGEGVSGQAAVAQVVLNRVKHPAYPKSVCGVVFQGAGRRGCQFSFACDGSMHGRRERAAWNQARGIAARVLAGNATGYIGSATHFHTTAVSPFWAPQMLRVAQVGVHVFYKFSPRRLRALPTGEPALEQAMLVSLPAAETPNVQVSPTIEKAIEASLQPVAPESARGSAAKAAPAAKPAAEAMLTTPQPVAATAS